MIVRKRRLGAGAIAFAWVVCGCATFRFQVRSQEGLSDHLDDTRRTTFLKQVRTIRVLALASAYPRNGKATDTYFPAAVACIRKELRAKGYAVQFIPDRLADVYALRTDGSPIRLATRRMIAPDASASAAPDPSVAVLCVWTSQKLSTKGPAPPPGDQEQLSPVPESLDAANGEQRRDRWYPRNVRAWLSYMGEEISANREVYPPGWPDDPAGATWDDLVHDALSIVPGHGSPDQPIDFDPLWFGDPFFP